MNRDRHRVALRLLIARRRRVLRDCTVGCKKNGICQNKIDTFLPTIFSWWIGIVKYTINWQMDKTKYRLHYMKIVAFLIMPNGGVTFTILQRSAGEKNVLGWFSHTLDAARLTTLRSPNNAKCGHVGSEWNRWNPFFFLVDGASKKFQERRCGRNKLDGRCFASILSCSLMVVAVYQKKWCLQKK
jgi:hypothetical protein